MGALGKTRGIWALTRHELSQRDRASCADRYEAAREAAADLLRALGADLTHDGVRETPRRMVAAYAELLTPQPFNPTTFPNDEGYDELVVVRAIPFHSLCMHHLLPSTAWRNRVPARRAPSASQAGPRGRALLARPPASGAPHHPDRRLARRRTAPKGVGVVLEAEHLCMSLRGVQKLGAKTVTSALEGWSG